MTRPVRTRFWGFLGVEAGTVADASEEDVRSQVVVGRQVEKGDREINLHAGDDGLEEIRRGVVFLGVVKMTWSAMVRLAMDK